MNNKTFLTTIGLPEQEEKYLIEMMELAEKSNVKILMTDLFSHADDAKDEIDLLNILISNILEEIAEEYLMRFINSTDDEEIINILESIMTTVNANGTLDSHLYFHHVIDGKEIYIDLFDIIPEKDSKEAYRAAAEEIYKIAHE